MEIDNIKGLGTKTKELLNNIGIYTISDLVRYYPYKFDIISRKSLDDEKSFDNMIVDGIVESNPIVSYFKGKNKISFNIRCQNRIVKVTLFNRAFIKNNIKVASYVTVYGKYNPKNLSLTATNITFGKLPDYAKIVPVYHMTKGLSSKKINEYINKALDMEKIDNNIPKVIIDNYNFMDEETAIKCIHNPDNTLNLKTALKTLKYEEMYTYLKKIKLLKEKNEKHSTSFIKDIDTNKVYEFINKLPFKLTIDQNKVIDEMILDLKSDKRMNRLLQGDVGSGKTIVAFILAYAVKSCGYQSALMAPTEALASQHYNNAIKLFNNKDFNIELLTGSTTLKDKKRIYEDLENGNIDFLIGTHSLINDNVKLNNLGLIITDEQHRFGVNQRLKLKNKLGYPDVLLMSATPIPRTYALMLYGDTDISSIKTMPNGRIPVKTILKKTDELKDVLDGIYKELKNKRQVYVISPMIEENCDTDYTNVYDLEHKFKLAFKNYTVKVLHGKMKNEEKEKIMDNYKNGLIDILISTTVIEVGIDVKNATVIVIFDADRFGLSTLHQLRGRVGRNNVQSYCYLISDKDKERLNIMTYENDGFKISEADFKLRGEGDLFGNRQSGALQFKLSNIKKDLDLFLKVKKDVDNN